jgi:hypothetical protein
MTDLIPADASQYQTLPASAGHSHSMGNEPFSLFNINGLLVGYSENTMKNTMVRNSWQ